MIIKQISLTYSIQKYIQNLTLFPNKHLETKIYVMNKI